MQEATEESQKQLPEIQPYFSQPGSSSALSKHIEKGREVLKSLLPDTFSTFSPEEMEKWASTDLPLVKWNTPTTTPESLTITFLLAPKQEVKAEKVLLEVIRRWLIPEKEVQILGFYNMYFCMKQSNSKLFFLAEVEVFVEDGRDLNLILENLPLLAGELSLCLSSLKYLDQFLDTKALAFNQKSTNVQQYLRQLIQRAPKNFDVELFREMSAFFALTRPDFHKFRQAKHLTRIIVAHYLMRRRLFHSLSLFPEKRHLDVRFIRSKLHFPFGVKSVLGLSVAVGLTDRYEVFEDTHVIAAVQKFIPGAHLVKGSYYSYQTNHDPIKYLYLELEKKDGTPFELQDVGLLSSRLKEELRKRIEKMIPSVFMIRNEEEVMRNILLLSQELKYLTDLPQVMVNFDKQGPSELYFTVLIVRNLQKGDVPLEEAFSELPASCRFIPDRVQNVGLVRKKNPKEANVFHLCIPKDHSILRTDSSVNFYLARQKVVQLISEVVGEVRDYNGGMILKQGELFTQLKDAFVGTADNHQELLENFFFALTPIEAQAVTTLNSLKALFEMFLASTAADLTKRSSVFQKFESRKNGLFAVLRTKDRSLEAAINEELNQFDQFSKALVRTKVTYQGTLLQGFIYETSNQAQQQQFQYCIEAAIATWTAKIAHLQELRLSFLNLPPSLDPRLAWDETSSTVVKMLFEGLTRISQGSRPALAIAKSVDISADQKRYTFKLRNACWSDQTPLVAQDFEYAWKKILSPSFYTPFAYFFYPIKNAKAAKEGAVGLDQVGVRAEDDKTLVIDLETPTPEFLELTAHALYSPINQQLEKLRPNWAQSGEEGYVCNGPFRLKRTLPHGGYEFIKNTNYWDRHEVKLDRVFVTKNNSETAFEQFKNDELEWIGRPMYPWESHFEKGEEDLLSNDSLGVNWCVFNTQRFPFDNLKMRQAFAYALDRSKLVKQLSDNTAPSVTPLPPHHSSIVNKKLLEGDRKLAVQLFELALKDLGLTRKTFPILTFIAAEKSTRRLRELLIEQWEEVLGVSCRLEEYDFPILFSKMVTGEYQIGMIAWKAWVNDPSYTLNVFQYRTNKVNFAKWEHPKYLDLLERAKQEIVPQKRLDLMNQAESVLIEECPVLPLNTVMYTYMHKKRLKNAFVSETGNIDFKKASIVP